MYNKLKKSELIEKLEKADSTIHDLTNAEYNLTKIRRVTLLTGSEFLTLRLTEDKSVTVESSAGLLVSPVTNNCIKIL